MKSPRRVLHLISQAHLDPVWLWPRRDGVAEVLTTFQSAVDRLRETPSFRFSRSSSIAYEWVKDADPRLFAEIQSLVAEGRWEIVGGWFEQPDCNLPGAESFLQQAAHARDFFQKAFGPDSLTPCGYNVDSFGHCGGLPQLLQEAGMDAYAFMRPEPWDKPGLPLLFWWESPDGSRVLAIRIPGNYSQSYAATADDIEAALIRADQEHFAEGFGDGVLWFGVGNHGGGPTREHIARVLELQAAWREDPAKPEIRFSTLRDFLGCLRNSPAISNLPVVKGELGYVFRGCYAANGETKRRHRAAEKALFSASAATASFANPESPRIIREAWRDLLFLQFHDILAGTCVASVQEEIIDRFGSVLTRARDALEGAALRRARRVDTSGETGSVLFAYNPLPWRRKALVSLDTFVRIHGRDEVVALESPDGAEVPIQWLSAEANFGPWGLPWGKLTAVVDLPPSGHCVYRLKTERVTTPPVNPFAPADSTNPQFGKASSESEATSSVWPGAAPLEIRHGMNENLLKSPLRFLAVADTGGTWGHGKKAYDEVLGEAAIEGHETLAEGEVLSIVRQKFRWGKSEIWMDIIRQAHTEDIELRLRFNWQEQGQQLKWEIPTQLTETQTQAKMPAEVVRRETDGHEYPCHDWVVLEGRSGESGQHRSALAVMNDSTYSYAAEGGNLRFTLARGVPHAEHPPFEYTDTRNVTFLDQGWQERRFLLRSMEADWAGGNLHRAAEELQIPAVSLLDSAHPGDLPREMAGIQVEPSNVLVMALEETEKQTIRLRLAEGEGKTCEAKVTWLKQSTKVPLKPFQIRTISIDPTIDIAVSV